RDTSDLECAQELVDAQVRVTDEVIARDPDIVEVQLARIETAPSDAAHLRPHGEAGRVLLDDKAREPRLLVLDCLETRQQGHPERHVRPSVGDERLPAIEQPATITSLGPCADPT